MSSCPQRIPSEGGGLPDVPDHPRPPPYSGSLQQGPGFDSGHRRSDVSRLPRQRGLQHCAHQLQLGIPGQRVREKGSNEGHFLAALSSLFCPLNKGTLMTLEQLS